MTEIASSQENNARIARAKGLIETGRLDAAEAEMQAILAAEPDERDALYVMAVAQRYKRRHADALNTLERLCAVAPDMGRAYQEIAYNRRACGHHQLAAQAFETATSLDPSLAASWKALADIHERDGDERRRRWAAAYLDWLNSLPKPLLTVANLIGDGRLQRAEEACRTYLLQHPTDVEAMRLLAQIGARLNVLDDAEFLLESVLTFAPDHTAARFEYASVLRKRQKLLAAREQMRLLAEIEPDNVAFQRLNANIATAIGDHEEALALYRAICAVTPKDERCHLSSGHALKTIGRLREAVDAYREAYRIRPDFGDAFWSLANLKTYRFTAEEVALAEAAEGASSTREEDRIHLCFALGKHYEDAGDAGQSFGWYERGNALRRSRSRYTIEGNRGDTERLMQVFTADLFDKHASAGCLDSDPIFIVGLPRSGSTLLEQILASHPMVDGTLELPNIVALVHRLDGRRRQGEAGNYPEVLARLDKQRLAEMGERYIEETRIHRAEAPYFIDKMPNNFKHVGLISLILPNARIIDARRHPMSCCFSNFRQLFAEGQEFTYGLEEIAGYYRDYVELMDHWDSVLPGKVLRVHYEEVTSDLEGSIRRILDYCDLPFDPACVEFYRNERAVRTPSAEQVRQPIYKEARDQWRKFEPWLDPLKAALGPALTAYPYS